MLTAAVLAITSTGCFRSRMLNASKTPARPDDASAPPDGARDGSADGRRDGAYDLRDARTEDLRDGLRDGLGDGLRDDGRSEVRPDSRSDASDAPADGARDTRRDGTTDRGSDIRCSTVEICGNGIDDDCNGLADCFDRACQSDPACIDRKKETCDNGKDDDGNGLVDCKDPACYGDKACIVPGREICNNNLDDDDDGLVDCADSDCAMDISCKTPGTEVCDNGKDDDGNGLVDCSDPACKTFAACLRSACSADLDFGTLAASGSTVTRTLTTTGAVATYSTCASPGGGARVASFALSAAADVKVDFSQSSNSAHVVAIYRAGVGQSCDQNPVGCLRAGDKPTATQTFTALPAGAYWVIVQSFPGTTGSTTLTLSTGTAGATEICDNGKDDDGDGAIDCADLNCASAPSCNLCVADVNLGAVVLGGETKTTTVDTTTSKNRYHPTCAGLSTGNDVVIRFSIKETVGLTLSWQQTGDHVYGLFSVPPQGQACDAKEGGCTDMGGVRSDATNWSFFDAGDYLLIFKARKAGLEGKITVSLRAFANRGVEICNNGIDDDNDGLVDCNDPDCVAVPSCQSSMCLPDGDLGNMDVGTRTSVHVDLTSATQVFQSDCGKGDGRGRAYRLNLLSPMQLDFTCTQTGDQVLQLAAQTGPLDRCDASIATCADPATLPSGCNFGIPDLQPGPYYLLVQAFTAGTEGTVDLNLRGVSQRTLEICNNGIDDDGDGAIDCNDRKCATDTHCLSLRCRPDKQLGLLALDGSSLSATVQTSGAGNDQQSSGCVTGSGGSDAVIGFSLPGKTDLTLAWAQVGNHALVLYQGETAPLPCEANTRIDCHATSGTSTGTYTLKALTAGRYYLVVDADKTGSEGGVVLQLSGLPAQ